ncbi:MAG: hypothetical protein IPG92_02530 [Flavobacteriales bacterium]|nr:hypothetical protein [Flavobacteriales bacterium]
MKRTTTALATILLAALAWAQVPTSSELVHLDIKGLPIAAIRCLEKDHDGALWIGTDNGLCRYDGVNVDVYRNIPGDSTSLPGNFVRDLVMDGRGMIWVSCFGGVGVFDPHLGGRSSSLPFARKALSDHGERFPRYDALDLFIDREDGIWLTCVANGLARYDATSGLFLTWQELHDVLPDGETHPFTMGVTRDAEGIVWFTDRIMLYRLDPSGHQLESYTTTITAHDARQGVHLARLIQDPQDPNTLWLGSRGAGLIHFDKRTGESRNYMITKEGPVDLKNIVWAMLPRTSGHLLVAIDEELRDFDTRSRTFSAPLSTLEWGTGTFESIGNALMQDEDDRIWVGTFNGLFTLPPRAADYRKWSPSAQLLCTASDHPGYWGAKQYANRMLFKLGVEGEPLDSLPLPYSEEHRFEPMSILQTREGDVLVGTTSGLFMYHPTTRALSREHFQDVEGLPRVPIGILSIVEDTNGSVWMAFNGQGLLHYRPSDAHTELVVPRVRRSAPAIRRAYRTVTEFGREHLAVTYETGGVGVLDTSTMKLADLMEYGTRGSQLTNINTLITRCDSMLFAVTNNEGIVELRYQGDSLRYVATYVDDQDRTNGFGDAAADSLGNIWIATYTGLVLFRAGDHSFQHIGPIDGLGMSSVASIIPDHDGCMFAWNSSGARFNANTFARPAKVSGLYIRSVAVRGVARDLGPLSVLVLPHDSNSVTINYAPIALLHADALHYEVKLDGHNGGWVDQGFNRSASYVGLPPGEYTFHVRIAGKEQSALGTGFSFTIVPAWWQTWWFRVLVALVSGGAVFFLSRYILQLRYHERIAALEREREIGAIRTRIARDIHDDIGSGLTRITMLSREMNSRKETGIEKERLASSIAHASTELIGQLSEIVWTVDPKNDDAEHFVAFVRDLLGRQFEELSVALKADLSVEAGMEQRDIPPDIKRNVVMILKETVSNALKHAGARTISVKLRIGTRELALHVEDDGAGFDTSAERSRGNGLGNLRKRSGSIGGTLNVTSDAQGTRYALHVPLPSPTFMRDP